MKNKGKIGIFAVAGLGILAIVAFVFAWLTFPGGSGPGFSLPAETAGVGSPAELNWQDCTGCTVSVSGSDGTVLLEQRVSGSGTLSLPTEEAGDYAVSLYGLFGNLIQQDSYQVTENRIYTEQDTFQLGESAAVRIDTDGLELTDEAWIGIYERGATPGVDDSFLWVLVSDGLPGNGIYYAMQMRGSTNLFLRYTGEYTAYLFTDGGYTPAASWDFSTIEEDGVLALRWDPDAHVDEPGDAQGFISLLGRPDAEDGEPVYICWGSDGEPLEGYDPLFILNAWDHYPVSGEIPAHTVFPEGATQVLACSAEGDKPGEVVACFTIQPELRYAEEAEEPLFTFAVLSDTHVTRRLISHNNANYWQALRQITAEAPSTELIVINGDITDNGAPGEYESLLDIEGMFPDLPAVYYTIGNHDSDKNDSDFSVLRERFLELTGTEEVYYSFEAGGSTFIMLGNEGAEGEDPDLANLSDTQLNWLDETLAEAVETNPDRPVFIFIHQPMEGTVAATFEGSDIAQSAELMEIIEKYPEAVVFSGHTHRSMTGTLALRSEDGFVSYLHDGVVCAVWDGTQDTYDSQGLVVSVYEDYIRVQGRSFADDAWLPLCNWKIGLD